MRYRRPDLALAPTYTIEIGGFGEFLYNVVEAVQDLYSGTNEDKGDLGNLFWLAGTLYRLSVSNDCISSHFNVQLIGMVCKCIPECLASQIPIYWPEIAFCRTDQRSFCPKLCVHSDEIGLLDFFPRSFSNLRLQLFHQRLCLSYSYRHITSIRILRYPFRHLNVDSGLTSIAMIMNERSEQRRRQRGGWRARGHVRWFRCQFLDTRRLCVRLSVWMTADPLCHKDLLTWT